MTGSPATGRLALTMYTPNQRTMQVGYWQPGTARLRLTTARVPRNVTTVYIQ